MLTKSCSGPIKLNFFLYVKQGITDIFDVFFRTDLYAHFIGQYLAYSRFLMYDGWISKWSVRSPTRRHIGDPLD